jgi:hypothetical protein
MVLFRECFGGIEDPRSGNAVRHELSELSIIALCAVLCGGESFDLAPKERLPRSMMYDHGNGNKMDEEIADGLHA